MSENRIAQIDALRGIAILLVLCRHSGINNYLTNVGWVGVDLFFVLSGYLITSLLLKEYNQYGTINFTNFFIRRGLKIYPLYYLNLCIFSIYFLSKGKFDSNAFLSECFFVQNYTLGFGWSMYGGSWSVAVEEHFYLLFALIIYLTIKSTKYRIQINLKKYHNIYIYILILISIPMIRVFTYNNTTIDKAKIFTMSHLRIDSFLWGSLLAVLIVQHKEKVASFFKSYSIAISLVICGLLVPFFFIDTIDSYFLLTIGFSMIAVAFSLLLGLFLFTKIVSPRNIITTTLASIGIASYSIYVTHTYLLQIKFMLFYKFPAILRWELWYNILGMCICIVAGYAVYYYFEKPILSFKSKFPAKPNMLAK